MDVPGFINELKAHTLAVAPRPNEPLAFAGALAMLAHLTGRSYRDVRGSRTNLYLAALAPSGMGKDEPRTTNKRLAAAVERLHSVPDSIASGEGLEDAMAVSPSLLLQTDEADTLLTSMRGGSFSARLNEMILRFFSEAKSSHALRQRAGDGAVEMILEPHLTLFTTGIPKFFFSALSAKALENGLLGRCLFLDTDAFVPFGEMTPSDLPASVVSVARRLAARETRNEETGVITPLVVKESPEASCLVRRILSLCDETTKRLKDSDLETAAALYVRIPEKAFKLAMLRAISRDDQVPIITTADLEWAYRLTVHLTKRMLYLSQFYVAEGQFDRLKKRVLGLIADAGGSLDRTTILRRMGIDSGTFTKIVKTLHMCDLIEEETLGRRKTIYSIKAA